MITDNSNWKAYFEEIYQDELLLCQNAKSFTFGRDSELCLTQSVNYAPTNAGSRSAPWITDIVVHAPIGF
jgi:hypothetical protein